MGSFNFQRESECILERLAMSKRCNNNSIPLARASRDLRAENNERPLEWISSGERVEVYHFGAQQQRQQSAWETNLIRPSRIT